MSASNGLTPHVLDSYNGQQIDMAIVDSIGGKRSGNNASFDCYLTEEKVDIASLESITQRHNVYTNHY